MWNGWDGWSPFFWVMPLMMIVFWVLVIVGIVFLVKWLVESSKPPAAAPPEQDPVNILKQRYAKGEITKEQFEEMKKDLSKK